MPFILVFGWWEQPALGLARRIKTRERRDKLARIANRQTLAILPGDFVHSGGGAASGTRKCGDVTLLLPKVYKPITGLTGPFKFSKVKTIAYVFASILGKSVDWLKCRAVGVVVNRFCTELSTTAGDFLDREQDYFAASRKCPQTRYL